jgi:hypothetical protein
VQADVGQRSRNQCLRMGYDSPSALGMYRLCRNGAFLSSAQQYIEQGQRQERMRGRYDWLYGYDAVGVAL